MSLPRHFEAIWRLAMFLCVVASAQCFSSASAEMTVERLTANAISGVGPYYQDVEDAIKEFGNKNYRVAYERLQSAKKSTPRLAPAEVMMAQLYLDLNQPQADRAALAMLEEAIRTAPKDPEAYVLLAERALSEGRVTEADMLFDKALKALEALNDRSKRMQNLQTRSFSGWATADEVLENWKDAKTKLEQLVKLDPRNAAAHDRLARILCRLAAKTSDLAPAFGEFRLAADYDKKLPPPEVAMAMMALVRNDKVRAEDWMKRAITTNGKDLRTRVAVTRFYITTNQLEEAKTHADEALKIDPKALDSNTVVGIVARMTGDYKTAIDALSKAHLLAPADGTINNTLAQALIELGDEESKQRALKFADLNVKENPGNLDYVATLGWVYYKLNRRKEALRAFESVIPPGEIRGMTSEMAFFMANLVKERGEIDKAKGLLQESLNTNQPFAYRKSAQDMLAQITKAEKSAGRGKAQPASAKDSERAKPNSPPKTEEKAE